MPVIGLVVTLVESDPREMARSLAALSALPGMDLGLLRGIKRVRGVPSHPVANVVNAILVQLVDLTERTLKPLEGLGLARFHKRGVRI